MSTELGRSGYLLRKTNDNEHIYNALKEKIQKELIATPIASGYAPVRNYYLFSQNQNNTFRIPRYYGQEIIGKPDKVTFKYKKQNKNLKFNGKLKPSQLPAIEATIKAFNNIGGGILCLPCGMGKTVCGGTILSQREYFVP